MIAYLRGHIIESDESSVIIDTGGIGYEVFVPYAFKCSLERSRGEAVEMYTHMQVRDEQPVLYGFANRQDLRIFRQLITVNGIGPKGALAIMTNFTTDRLILAILAEDSKAIAKTPGIGAKTAAKLVLELKDKFSFEDTLSGTDAVAAAGEAQHGADEAPAQADSSAEAQAVRTEAAQALSALGYSNSEALRAVRSVPFEEGMTVEKMLKLSLKAIR